MAKEKFESKLIYNLISQYIKQNRIGDIILEDLNKYLLKNKYIPNPINEIKEVMKNEYYVKLNIKINNFNIDFWFEDTRKSKHEKATHVFAISKEALLEMTTKCEIL